MRPSRPTLHSVYETSSIEFCGSSVGDILPRRAKDNDENNNTLSNFRILFKRILCTRFRKFAQNLHFHPDVSIVLSRGNAIMALTKMYASNGEPNQCHENDII